MQDIQNALIDLARQLLGLIGIHHDATAGVLGTFLFLMMELLVLFILISYIVALLQIYIPKEKIQRALTTRSKLLNSVLGALLGSVTPFCSCSTIPMLMGLIKSRAPFAGMMSFLLTSPILNPAIIVLLLTFFGWMPTALYTGVALVFAIVTGYVLDRKNFARFIKQPQEDAAPATSCCDSTPAPTSSCCDSAPAPATSCCDSGCKEIRYDELKGSFITKNIKASAFAMRDAMQLFNQVFFYLLPGAGIGAFIYGFVPTEFLAQFAGKNNFFTVPLAAIAGIPMYIRTETMIPIADVLIGKGVGLGTMMALIIGGAGASIPELSLLSAIFKKQLVITFLGCILGIAVLTGYLFNILL